MSRKNQRFLIRSSETCRDPILRDEFDDAEARFWLTQTSLKHLLVEAQVHADSRLVDRLNGKIKKKYF